MTMLLNCTSENPSLQTTDLDFVKLSNNFVSTLKERKNTEEFVQQYKEIDLHVLKGTLNTKNKHLAFWINTYNAFIQQKLLADPSLFDDRSTFYKSEFINIGGEMMSFDLIEHGIIRNSRWKYGLGYIKKWFVSKLERKLRRPGKDGRVHFALNCGAKSCPPVAPYSSENLDEELKFVIRAYLPKVTEVKGSTVKTSPLFSWFRGDFGGKRGVINFLNNYGIITLKQGALEYGEYDWTLDLDRFVELK